jgi:pimeloyl-ACP methyl ester carboxylesterase
MFNSILPFSLLALAVNSAVPASAQATTEPNFARPQQMIDIGGRRLNLVCSGSGPVTVVFDAYSGGAAWDWFEVLPTVAKRTRACAYDRAGLGFSDPSSNPTLGNAVEDLHKLLGAAGIAPPYVLVGSSYGGAAAQLYAYRYPKEVAGLVLVEPHHEDEFARGNKVTGGKLEQMQHAGGEHEKACAAQSLKGFVPGSELWNNCIGPILPNVPRALAAARIASRQSAAFWKANLAESANIALGDKELGAARAPFGDLPIIVLSRGLPTYGTPGPKESALSRAFEADNRALHKELAALSTRGSQRIVPDSHHIIADAQPAAVAGAVDELLNLVGR